MIQKLHVSNRFAVLYIFLATFLFAGVPLWERCVFAEELTLTAPRESEIVEPFSENVLAWLRSDTSNVSVSDFALGNRDDQGVPVTLSWVSDLQDVEWFEVSCEPRMEGASSLHFKVSPTENGKNSVSVLNLFRGTVYDWKVTAYTSDGVRLEAASYFQMGTLGPRVIFVDGIHNVRDSGGFETSLGKRTRQGLLFRGSEMNGKHGIQISAAGIRTMTEELGIRTDLDLRSPLEALNITESPLGSCVRLVFLPVGNYTAAFTSPNYQKIFSLMADARNYPIYFHCWGGADRTGTVAFLLNALLGVPEDVLIRDFEFTSFSVFGIRDSQKTKFDFQGLYAKLQTYQGTTLAEKTENYMLSIGVTPAEIQAIREILIEEPTFGR